MLPFTLENHLFLLSSEILDGVTLPRHLRCSPVGPRNVLAQALGRTPLSPLGKVLVRPQIDPLRS
jgi:hypothetical protein